MDCFDGSCGGGGGGNYGGMYAGGGASGACMPCVPCVPSCPPRQCDPFTNTVCDPCNCGLTTIFQSNTLPINLDVQMCDIRKDIEKCRREYKKCIWRLICNKVLNEDDCGNTKGKGGGDDEEEEDEDNENNLGNRSNKSKKKKKPCAKKPASKVTEPSEVEGWNKRRDSSVNNAYQEDSLTSYDSGYRKPHRRMYLTDRRYSDSRRRRSSRYPPMRQDYPRRYEEDDMTNSNSTDDYYRGGGMQYYRKQRHYQHPLSEMEQAYRQRSKRKFRKPPTRLDYSSHNSNVLVCPWSSRH